MRHLNQSGLISQETMDRHAIGIIGTGAIGSFVAMALTKMGFKNLVTWDPDKIEEHNIANQMFPVESVGSRKAIATRAMVKQFSGEDVICLATQATGKKAADYMNETFDGKNKIIILAVDSLDVRRALVDQLAACFYGTIIDARMGAKTYRVLAFSAGDGLDEYLATLVPDANAVQERCGQKSIIYTVLGVAAEVCSFVHQVISDETRYPQPVIFDYGTGMRMQRRLVGEVLGLDEVVEQDQPAGVEVPF